MPIDIDRDFQAEQDMLTLLSADDIKKSPERIKAAQRHAIKQRDRMDEAAKSLTPTKSSIGTVKRGMQPRG